MDWLKKMKEAQNKCNELLKNVKAENRAFTDDEQKDFDSYTTEVQNCKNMLENEKKTKEFEVESTTVVDGQKPNIQVTKNEPLFKNLGDQLCAIKNSATSGNIDERLLKLRNSATGMNAGVGTDGGYAIQEDFAGNMMDSAVKESPLLSKVDTFNVSSNSDTVKWMGVDEKDISNTVFGGISVNWAAEAGTVAATKPVLKEEKLSLEKLMGFAYTTWEFDLDTNFADQLLTKGFSLAISRKLEGNVISGDGIGKPLGILKGDGLIVLPKESGQTNDTIVWENMTKMYHRRDNVMGTWGWLMHPDAHEQLDYMDRAVGTGGVPVYQPASMTGTVPVFRGLPIIPTDHCSALGDKGDVILTDLNDYMLIKKGGVQKDMSIHVEFLTAENCFRFMYRANGRPKTLHNLTIKNSAKIRGKRITLAAR